MNISDIYNTDTTAGPYQRFNERILEILQDLIKEERRVAAEAMRKRCAGIADEAADTLSYEPMKTAKGIAYQIRTLPLDSDGGV